MLITKPQWQLRGNWLKMLDISEKIIATALSVLKIEAQTVHDLAQKINPTFVNICQSFLNCTGRIVVTGIGKSGHIGKKIAATLASTGTPAFFVHPAEAVHGDLGMITSSDLVLALSYSGETSEILALLPAFKRLGTPIIALTGAPDSTLATLATFHLDVGIQQEACPLGLAPTASAIAMLAMGDALAMAILEARGFTVDDFAKSHPGGQLGRRLLLKIKDVMHTGPAIPKVPCNALLLDALMEMTGKRLGFTAIVDSDNPDNVIGIFTDGDLRRVLTRKLDIHKTPIKTVMTTNFTTIQHTQLASEAIAIMEKLKILVLPVLDEQKKLIGALNMHDLFKARVI